MTRNQIKWTFGPALLLAAFLIFTSLVIPDIFSLDTALLVEQFIIACVLIATVFTTKKFVHAGWQKKSGFAWLWVAGPMWLGVLTPIGLALPFMSSDAVGFALLVPAVRHAVFTAIRARINIQGFGTPGQNPQSPQQNTPRGSDIIDGEFVELPDDDAPKGNSGWTKN